MRRFGKIVVTTDFSELSSAAFPYARTLAEIYDAEIVILHVIDEPVGTPVPPVGGAFETVLRDEGSGAIKQLQEIQRRYFGGRKNVSYLVVRGDAGREIVRAASAEHADCVVIATHGRTGILRALVGSVAETVVRHSVVPVLTVTPDAAGRSNPARAEGHTATETPRRQ